MSKIPKNRTHYFSFAELIIFSSIILFVGIEIGFLLHFYIYKYVADIYQRISIQIDPLNIVTLVVTVVLSVYILRNLNKKDERNKKRAGLLANYIGKWEDEFGQYMRKTVKSDEDNVLYDSVTQNLKIFRMRFNALVVLYKEEKMVDDKCSPVINLNENLHDILELLTDTPKTGSVDSQQIQVKEGKIIFNSRIIYELETKMTRNQVLVFNLISEIDKNS